MSFSNLLLMRVLGWKTKGDWPDVEKCVVIMAPHTSFIDFFVGKMYLNVMKKKVNYLIKSEAFVFPFKRIIIWLGGVPVERSKRTNLVDQMIEKVVRADRIFLAITPEGTRKKVDRWKRGFYYIASKANVPIFMTYLDYKRKIIGFGPLFYPTGDINADMKKIKHFYKGMRGLYANQFSIGDADYD